MPGNSVGNGTILKFVFHFSWSSSGDPLSLGVLHRNSGRGSAVARGSVAYRHQTQSGGVWMQNGKNWIWRAQSIDASNKTRERWHFRTKVRLIYSDSSGNFVTAHRLVRMRISSFCAIFLCAILVRKCVFGTLMLFSAQAQFICVNMIVRKCNVSAQCDFSAQVQYKSANVILVRNFNITAQVQY